MKKLHLLIPTLAMTASMPLVGFTSLTSCAKNKTTHLTFDALEDGQLSCDIYYDCDIKKDIDLQYSINDQEWQQLETNDEDGQRIHFVSYKKGDSIRLRGNNKVWSYYDANSGDKQETKLHFTGLGNISGNVLSLLFGDEYTKAKNMVPDDYEFQNLFEGINFFDEEYSFRQISSAQDLILPQNLTKGCYEYMFYVCEQLVTPPRLTAVTLAEGCYEGMFSYCSSLTVAPELPATTLANYCYESMFDSCFSLTTAPALPVTTLADGCYSYMFDSCLSLTTAPILPATTLARSSYANMFHNCDSLKSAPELPATTLAEESCYCMFYECDNLERTMSVLPATSLCKHCYHSMFSRCPKLTTAPEILATSFAEDSCEWMFSEDPLLKIKEQTPSMGAGEHKIFTCPKEIDPEDSCHGMLNECYVGEGYFTGTPYQGNTYYWCE